jgi:hypothetical protein
VGRGWFFVCLLVVCCLFAYFFCCSAFVFVLGDLAALLLESPATRQVMFPDENTDIIWVVLPASQKEATQVIATSTAMSSGGPLAPGDLYATSISVISVEEETTSNAGPPSYKFSQRTRVCVLWTRSLVYGERHRQASFSGAKGPSFRDHADDEHKHAYTRAAAFLCQHPSCSASLEGARAFSPK